MVWHVRDPMEANVSLQQKMGRQVGQGEATVVVGLGDLRDGIQWETNEDCNQGGPSFA